MLPFSPARRFYKEYTHGTQGAGYSEMVAVPDWQKYQGGGGQGDYSKCGALPGPSDRGANAARTVR